MEAYDSGMCEQAKEQLIFRVSCTALNLLEFHECPSTYSFRFRYARGGCHLCSIPSDTKFAGFDERYGFLSKNCGHPNLQCFAYSQASRVPDYLRVGVELF
jgi:hypothetical protein